MSDSTYLFTSESVSEGHPDKVADQISDAVLDAILAQDPMGRVACETMVTTGLTVMAGEITTSADVDFVDVARKTIARIGYDDPGYGFSASDCGVISMLDAQSPDIAMGVDTGGAGDQGLMFGYACSETEQKMPLSIVLAHDLVARLASVRCEGGLGWLRPDGKSQVTIEFGQDGTPQRVHTVVVSTQHDPEPSNDEIRDGIIEHVIQPTVPADLLDDDTIIHVNPTGRFVTGGPLGDCGLTGRKIIVDTYGGVGRHGGGAFSGKDPTKVDRSACYMARYVAKNVVAAGLASKVEVQLAYAIGVAEPVSVHVDSYGTGEVDDRQLESAIRDTFSLTPKGIIETLDLRRPIYEKTAAHGHFGRDEFSWEKTDRVDDLRGAV